VHQGCDGEDKRFRSTGSTGADLESGLAAVTRVFSDDPDIVFALLFGSQAKQTAGPLSDVDLAVYLRPGLHRDARFDKAIELAGLSSMCLKTSKVDVIALNDASPELAYSVFKHGRLLFCKDDLLFIRTKVRAINFYIDRAPLRAIFRKYLAGRVRDGEYGH